MRIEKTFLFMVLLIFATLSGPVTAYDGNNSTINSNSTINNEDDAKDRIKYLESQIESLIKEEDGINIKIMDNNNKIGKLNEDVKFLASEISRYQDALRGKGQMSDRVRKVVEWLVKDLGNRRHAEIEQINNLEEENHDLELQKVRIQKLRGNYSLEMEDLKLKWGIIDPA